MSDQVVLTEFPSEVEASLAVAVLAANGVHAEVRRSGSGFYMTMAGRTAILVDKRDIARARQVLGPPGQ
jgi:type III secretory pathway lipoprotein EscJ